MNRLRYGRATARHGLVIVCALLVFLMGPGSRPCAAHPGSIASALAKVQADGSFQLRLRFDLLAYALEELPNRISDAPMNALLDGPSADLDSRLTDAKTRFRQNFHVGGLGTETIDTLTFPTATDVLHGLDKADRVRLPVMGIVTVTGHLPPNVRTVAFQFDEVLGSVVLTTELPYQEPVSEPVEAGAVSSPLTIPSAEVVAKAQAASHRPPSAKVVVPAPTPPAKTPARQVTPVRAVRALVVAPSPLPSSVTPSPLPTASPVPASTPSPQAVAATPKPTAAKDSPAPSPTPSPSVVTVTARVPSPVQLPSPSEAVATAPPVMPPPSSRWLPHLGQYVKMGFEHILPEGIDHILFVLGLFLLSTRTKTLIKQVTAFTIAHSLTLALSLYGIVHLPASIVEPVIAASIAFVAIENLFTTEMKAWRPMVVFGFGLIHGLGFAEALQSMGLRHHDLLPALVGFNVGVELGQLTVVAAAFVLVGRFRHHANYRKYVIVPGSLAIAVTALFWTVQRLL